MREVSELKKKKILLNEGGFVGKKFSEFQLSSVCLVPYERL